MRATGIAVSTIGRELVDLADPAALSADRVSRPGGGRKTLLPTNTTLHDDLLGLVSPGERGDPMSPLRWTCKSLRRLAHELGEIGHQISHTVVGELLKAQKFSLQTNRDARLHWTLDVVFRDDLARLRSGNGPANRAVVKHTAMNPLTQAKPIVSLKNR